MNKAGGAVHRAAKFNKFGLLKKLLEADPQLVHVEGFRGQTPLHYAARGGASECVQVLIDFGANVNAPIHITQMTPLHDAANGKVAQQLIEGGAVVNSKSSRGRIPLDSACQRGLDDVARVLIHYGADIHYLSENRLTTMLQWAMSEPMTKSDQSTELYRTLMGRAELTVEVLLAGGSDPNQANDIGQTSMHFACCLGSAKIVKALLDHGGDPNIRTRYKESAFVSAHPDILWLIEPLRQIVSKEPKPDRTPKQLIRRLLRSGMAKKNDLLPCTANEIAALEKRHGVYLPTAYKIFLQAMGKGAGDFLVNDHWYAFYDHLMESGLGTTLAPEDLEELEFELPANSFVFATRMGEVYLYFVIDRENDDPPVFGWNSNEHKKMFDSFWSFFEAMIDDFEALS